MAQIEVNGLKIVGISTSVPSKVVSNNDYDILSISERELFIKTTGVKNRRVASVGTTTSDMGVHAANSLFEKTAWNREEIDLLVFVTQSRDYYLPSTAVIAQNKLKLSTSCMAFDVGLGCSGYVYGLSIVASLLNSGKFQKAILIAGDISTVSCNYHDKSSYPLFGDAVSATFIEKTENNNKWTFDLFSDGSGENAIKIPSGGMKKLPNKNSFEEIEFEGGIKRNGFNLVLNGIDIFNFSVTTVPKSISTLFEQKQLSIDEIDFFIMHQANLLMNETIRKKLKLDKEKVPYSIHEFGNTSSASIPLTMCLMDKEKFNNSKLLLSGFGVGLSWANAILDINSIQQLLVNEYK